MSLINSILKTILIRAKWEVDIVRISTVKPDKFTREKIQRGSQVVNDIANNHRELFWNLFYDPKNPTKIPWISILLHDHSMRMSAHVRSNFVVQFADMLLGPLDF